MLNYDEELNSHNYRQIAHRIEQLFGMPYDEAFDFYSSKLLNI